MKTLYVSWILTFIIIATTKNMIWTDNHEAEQAKRKLSPGQITIESVLGSS